VLNKLANVYRPLVIGCCKNLLSTLLDIDIDITRSIAVAKNADRTKYDVRCSCRREPRKCRVWKSHGHLTTLHVAIPDVEISAVRFSAVCWLNDTSYSVVVLVVQWLSVGLVIERPLVRLPAGALSSQLGQLSLPSLWGR